ncbi:MAG TPA: LCP family protein [Thermomicrobiales bacterium]|jgi:LCP family protein required for cell wall assembly
MTTATQPTSQGMRRRTKILLGALVALLVVGLIGGLYANYRVNRFVNTTFRPDNTAPQTQFGETPTAGVPIVAQATVAPTPAAPAPTQDPSDPNTPTPPAPTVAPTAVLTPTATPLPYGNSPIIKRLKENQRINVLLIGFGGPGHDGGYLTDTLQVMSFEPKTGGVTLISVPRDLWIQLPQYQGRGGYWGRINEAYTVGMGNVDRNDMNIPYSKHDAGGQMAMKAVSQVLGIPLDYWISLDFVGFRRFIDAIGGVNVNVERAFTDREYPNNDDADIDPSYRTVHFDAGIQHMNGETAITFARSRHAPEDGSDFGRARRQQLLMSAVKDQIVSVETIPKLFGILDALEGHIRMSFSFTEARDLLGWGQEQARNNRKFAISSGVIDSNRLLYGATSSGGASILLPRAGQGNYNEIQSWVRDLLATNAATPTTSPNPAGTPGTRVPGALPTTTR